MRKKWIVEKKQMAVEANSWQGADKVRTDVLSKSRLACYKARDAFYACVEREASKKPTEVACVGLLFPAECRWNREEYVYRCRPTWVKHFDREYCWKKIGRRLLDDNEARKGSLSLPQTSTFKLPSSS